MTSNIERVNSFRFLFFCHAGEILVGREKKKGLTNRQSHHVCLLFLENNKKVSSKDFYEKIWFMMIYQDLFIFYIYINNTTVTALHDLPEYNLQWYLVSVIS